MAKTISGSGGSVSGASGGRWLVGVLAVAGAFALAYALSPGLRADLGGLGTVVTAVGGAYAAGVKDFILSFGILSPAAYLFAMVVQVFIAPIPSAPVSLIGSLVFGVWEGFGLSLAGSIVGSVLAFLAVRRWGEPLVRRLVGGKAYSRYVGALGGGGWWLFLVLLVPFAPDDAAVALAGLSGLSFRAFLPLMILGRVPGHATTALLASDWVTGSAAVLITVGVVVAAILALAFFYRERLESWMLHREDDAQTVAGDAGIVAASREDSR
ncbi:MAG: hypothetical protein AVDCRST_MAG03-49 [uncultured Rubrobacteraceae bacterium]|uniref:TVP38/TMEM64 family membrane protein n=1 Tax=uncultured Rubrobacteraceae bacterium TaxID=349277 RepID=A0A6J4NH09_9ACTN|nr:MAG: hypothetical protein AVDCRST_MAG03-49 [uncultured Rubrobacteraceae bacterium]